jgi:hypothetical protein
LGKANVIIINHPILKIGCKDTPNPEFPYFSPLHSPVERRFAGVMRHGFYVAGKLYSCFYQHVILQFSAKEDEREKES